MYPVSATKASLGLSLGPGSLEKSKVSMTAKGKTVEDVTIPGCAMKLVETKTTVMKISDTRRCVKPTLASYYNMEEGAVDWPETEHKVLQSDEREPPRKEFEPFLCEGAVTLAGRITTCPELRNPN